MPKLSEFLFGKKESVKQVPTMTPEQQALQSQLLQILGPLLGQGGDFLGKLFGDTEAFAAPYKRQFEEVTIPGIAERFSAADGQRSSAFTQALGSAGAGLEEQLAALQGQLGQQGISQLMGLLSAGQQPSFSPYLQSGTTGFLPGLGSGLMNILGNLGGQVGQQFGTGLINRFL